MAGLGKPHFQRAPGGHSTGLRPAARNAGKCRRPARGFAAWPGKTLDELGERQDRIILRWCLRNSPARQLSTRGLRARWRGKLPRRDGRGTCRQIGRPGWSPWSIPMTAFSVLACRGSKPRGDAARSFARSGWIGTIAVDTAAVVRAYAILDDDRSSLPAGKRADDSPYCCQTEFGVVRPGSYLDFGRSDRPADLRISSPSAVAVTWGQSPSSYLVDWQVNSIASGSRQLLGRGQLSTSGLKDWEFSNLTVSTVADVPSEAIEIEITVPPGQDVSVPLGLPLYSPPPGGQDTKVEIDGAPAADGVLLYQIPEAVTPVRDIQISICLIQHGERGRFAMPIPLRADFHAGLVRPRPNDRRMARRLGGFWRWRRFTTGRPAPRRRRSAA